MPFPPTGFLSRLRHRMRRLAGRAPAPASVIGFEHDGHVGTFERVEGAPLPIVRAFGWYSGPSRLPLALDTLQRSGVAPTVYSKTLRRDVRAAGFTDDFCGFRADFILEAGEQPVALRLGERILHRIPPTAGYARLEPHYRGLFKQKKVLGRTAIYGSGPPTNVSEEFKTFALRAEGEVLDFGCGNGDVVLTLRSKGRHAHGIELDEPRIRKSLKPGAEQHVTLYGGGIPLPFADASFDWVVSTEVIEHIPDIARYIPELHRVLRPGGKVLVTTPDITSIPSSFPTNSVPWHLLEATHVNFFTPASAATLFATHFDPDATYCLGSTRINGFFVPGSIGAIFVRREAADG